MGQEAEAVTRAAVVGAGQMGNGIAHVFAASGRAVTLIDVSAEAVARGRDTIARNLAVVREDYEICVSTHRNYEAGNYSAGPLSPRHEQGVHYFQERVKESLGAAP